MTSAKCVQKKTEMKKKYSKISLHAVRDAFVIKIRSLIQIMDVQKLVHN